MKYPLETIETFICLRAKGWSYGRIADKLTISKATAYDWADKYRNEVAKFRAIELEAIHERLLADYETEITWLATELKRVQDELKSRDYGYVDTHKLWCTRVPS
jgi:transposase